MLRVLTFFWFSLCCAFCAFPMQPAHAASPGEKVATSYYEDVSGQLTLADVEKHSLTPFSGMLRAGFGSSAYWVRIDVPQALRDDSDRRHALVLRITPTFVDQIAVYQTCNGTANVRYIGDQYPIAAQAYPALSLNLYLEPCALAQPVWLRIQSTSSRNVHIAVLPVRKAIQDDFRHFMTVLSGAGLILFLLLLIAIYEGSIKEPIFVAFAVQQLAILTIVLFNNGMERLYLNIAPLVSDRLGSFLTILIELTVLYFNTKFLQAYRISHWFRPGILVLAAMTIVNLALVFTHLRGAIMFTNAMVISVSIAYLFAMSLTIVKKSERSDLPSPLAVKFYYGALAFFVLPPLLAFFGMKIQYQPDIATVYGAFSTLVMTAILVKRARLRARLDQSEKLALAVRLQKLEQEQKFRDQQEQLFTMLVHEVKTPIAALKIALTNAASLDVARSKAVRHLDSVTTIINHCNQAYRLEDPAFEVSRSHVTIAKIIEKTIGENDIDIRINPDVPDDIETDAQLFHAIVGNIVDNAIRYKAPGTIPLLSVGLESKASRSGLLVEVANAPGPAGVPDADRVFSKYYRSGNAQHTTGSGLGLFLAYRSALRIGGELSYAFDGKIRFRLWLPN